MKRTLFLMPVFLFLLLSGVLAQADDGLRIVEAFQVEGKPFFQNIPLVIQSDKGTYVPGEYATIQLYQDINANCEKLISDFKVYDPGGKQVSSLRTNMGSAGYMTAYVKVSQKILETFVSGQYTLVSDWECTISGQTKSLGTDGYFDERDIDERFRFTVLNEEGQDVPQPLTCNLNCDVGRKLVNPESQSCYCQDTWKADDGKCDLGEPTVTADCTKEQSCASGQVLEGNTCLSPCVLEPGRCKEDSSSSSKVPPADTGNNSMGIVVVLLATVGGALIGFAVFGPPGAIMGALIGFSIAIGVSYLL